MQICILYIFFWVFPLRQIVVGRRFGTLCQFHLQRLDVDSVYIQPLKMELTQGSETSANYNLTQGKYPKEYIQYSNHSESLKSKICIYLIKKLTFTCLKKKHYVKIGKTCRMHEETTDASPMLESIKLRAYLFLELECNTVSITTFFVQCSVLRKKHPYFRWLSEGVLKNALCVSHTYTPGYIHKCMCLAI